MRGRATMKTTNLKDFSDLQRDYEKGPLNTICLSSVAMIKNPDKSNIEEREGRRKEEEKDGFIWFTV